jgi:phospholipid-binding lipoprotein MlaA
MLNISRTKVRNSFLLSMILIGGLNNPLFAQDTDSAPDTVTAVDPWQGLNRSIFGFNEMLDKCCLKPLAIGYRAVMPDPLEKGVSNVFANLLEVPNVVNGLLQADFKGAAKDTGRFMINSTLGLAGLVDVAQYMHLPADEGEDFGQTLAVWGVGSGPYVVLPFFGPSTLRDGLGKPLDWYSNPITYINHVPTFNTTKGISLVESRAELLDLEKNVVGDKYVFYRDVYMQRREYLIRNGEVVDDFGMDDFTDEGFDDAAFGGDDSFATAAGTAQPESDAESK